MNCPICNSRKNNSFIKLYDDRYGYPGVYDLLECLICRHKYLKVSFNEDELINLYTNFYPRKYFDLESYKPLEFNHNFQSWFNGEFRAFSSVPQNIKILDIGCGFGESLGFHKSRGCEVHGVEADENLKRVALKFGYNVQIGPFNHMNYEENYFDYVTMDQVIEHLVDPQATLSGIHRILKYGGFLAFTTPNSNGWGAKFFGKKWINWHAPYHLQHFSIKSFRILAEKNGFLVNRIKFITSSEWLKYQKIHNLVFPMENGVPSFFWSSNAIEIPRPIINEIEKINYWHNKKLNHVITRLFDLINFGDNYFVIFQKRLL